MRECFFILASKYLTATRRKVWVLTLTNISASGTMPVDPCKYILSGCWDKQGRFGSFFSFRCLTYLCVWLCPLLYKIPPELCSVLHLETRPVGLISNRYEPYILDQKIKPMVKCNESVKSYSSSCSALHMRSDGWLLGFICNPDSFSL